MSLFRVFVLSLGLFLCLIQISSDAFATVPSATTPPATTDDPFKLDSKDVDYYNAAIYCEVRSFIKGSFGTLLGLLISLVGGYTYLIKKSGYGLFFFIAGVAFTALPGIFDWYYRGVVAAFDDSKLGRNKSEIVTLEDWCDSSAYSNGNNNTSGGISAKEFEHDEKAEEGLGLNSILDGNEYYCTKFIKSIASDGTVTMGDEYCLK